MWSEVVSTQSQRDSSETVLLDTDQAVAQGPEDGIAHRLSLTAKGHHEHFPGLVQDYHLGL